MLKVIGRNAAGFQTIGLAFALSLLPAAAILDSMATLRMPLLLLFFAALGMYLYTWYFTMFIACVGFLIPLSIPLDYGGHVINLPSEILMLSLGLVFLLRIVFNSLPTRKFLLHPISIFIMADLAWT